MPLAFFPKRFLVDGFMRWLTWKENLLDHDVRALSNCLVDQMDLGLKHFRMPAVTLRVGPVAFSDEELRRVQAPTLLLIGDHEVLYDPAAALDRARRLIPSFEGQLVWRASHDMPYSQHRVVDARVLEFLNHSAQ
jgi:pimeloyl-ACP methyl ester carboxylesterase